jgi:hypothetical protein
VENFVSAPSALYTTTHPEGDFPLNSALLHSFHVN